MTEYISKEAALDVIDDLFQATARGEITNARYVATLADGRIEDIPAADVRQNVSAKWENVGFMAVKCSNCHETFYELTSDNFCPNCGADMKGGSNG